MSKRRTFLRKKGTNVKQEKFNSINLLFMTISLLLFVMTDVYSPFASLLFGYFKLYERKTLFTGVSVDFYGKSCDVFFPTIPMYEEVSLEISDTIVDINGYLMFYLGHINSIRKSIDCDRKLIEYNIGVSYFPDLSFAERHKLLHDFITSINTIATSLEHVNATKNIKSHGCKFNLNDTNRTKNVIHDFREFASYYADVFLEMHKKLKIYCDSDLKPSRSPIERAAYPAGIDMPEIFNNYLSMMLSIIAEYNSDNISESSLYVCYLIVLRSLLITASIICLNYLNQKFSILHKIYSFYIDRQPAFLSYLKHMFNNIHSFIFSVFLVFCQKKLYDLIIQIKKLKNLQGNFDARSQQVVSVEKGLNTESNENTDTDTESDDQLCDFDDFGVLAKVIALEICDNDALRGYIDQLLCLDEKRQQDYDELLYENNRLVDDYNRLVNDYYKFLFENHQLRLLIQSYQSNPNPNANGEVHNPPSLFDDASAASHERDSSNNRTNHS